MIKKQKTNRKILLVGLFLILSMNFISAELNYTTGESIYTGINSPNNALDGILSYPHIFNKSLTQDEIINWSTYTGELLIASGEDLVLPVNRFLQYQAKLQTNDTKWTPFLWEVNAEYDADYGEEITTPSSGSFNLFFKTLTRTTELIYFLEFRPTVKSNATFKDYAWIGDNSTPSTSTIGDYAIDIIERSVCGMMCQATKWIFGMTDLPEHINETNYYVMFSNNQTADTIVKVPINITKILEVSGYSNEVLDNQSLRLYSSTIFGGLESYNSSQDDIPFYVE